MAGKNQVTLTFAGETKQLEQSFDRVGQSAQAMERDVGQAARGFDRASEAADSAENKAQGFASTLTGTADTAAGVGQIMKGNLFEGFVMAGGGLADLAEGFNYTLIPAMKGAVTWLKATRVGTIATTAASKAAAVAKRAWAAAQWLLNIAMRANPIGLVITVIALLVAGIIIAYKRSETFRNIVQAAFRGVLFVGRLLWQGIQTYFNAIGAVFNWLVGKGRILFSNLSSSFRSIVSAVRTVASAISAPFRAAFSAVARAWNSTVGRLSWTVPGWVPFIGGNSISVPNIPTFHRGGIVPGAPGSEMLAVLQAGERVTPAGGSATSIEIRSGGSRLDDLLVEILSRAIRVRGGDVQTVLGSA